MAKSSMAGIFAGLGTITPLILGGVGIYFIYKGGFFEKLGALPEGIGNMFSGIGGGIMAGGTGIGKGFENIGGGYYQAGAGIGGGIFNVGAGVENFLSQLGGLGVSYNTKTGLFELGGGANTPEGILNKGANFNPNPNAPTAQVTGTGEPKYISNGKPLIFGIGETISQYGGKDVPLPKTSSGATGSAKVTGNKGSGSTAKVTGNNSFSNIVSNYNNLTNPFSSVAKKVLQPTTLSTKTMLFGQIIKYI